jgi:glyoxylase-like metal-dependent hydrolase (beta-lactamase superfamily II)
MSQAEAPFRIPLPMPGALSTVNVYLLGREAGDALLVDAGFPYPDTADAIRQALAVRGVSKVGRILLTHAHPDHVGAAAELQRAFGAEVYLTAEALAFLRRTQRPDWMLKLRSFLVAAGVPAEEAAAVTAVALPVVELPHTAPPPPVFVVGGEDWQLLPTPGHSPGHVALLGPGGVLIGGDLLLPGETPNVSFLPEQGGDPLGEYLRSVAAVARLRLKRLLPGHGEETDDVGAPIRLVEEHHAARRRDVEAALAAGATTLYEVAQAIPWAERRRPYRDLGPTARRLALGEAMAHLAHLCAVGRAERVGGGFRLRPTGG